MRGVDLSKPMLLQCLLALLVGAAAVPGQWLETTIPVPDSFLGVAMPKQLVYDSARNRVYVGGEETRAILVLDATDGHILARIPLDGDVSSLCYSSTGSKVYAAAADRDLVAVIDADAMQLVDTIWPGDAPVALTCNPALNRIYCANLDGQSVCVIDCENDSVLATVQVGQQPFSLCWNPTRNVVYCADSGANTVSVIDAASNAVIQTIPVGTAPVGFAYAWDIDKLYVANSGSGSVSVIDGLADTVLVTVAGGDEPARLCYNPTYGKVYVADRDPHLIVIDCATDTILRSVQTYEHSYDVNCNPVNNRVYAACYRLDVLDCASDSIVADVEFGGRVAAVCIADSGRRAFGAGYEDEALVGVADCGPDSLLTITETDLQVKPTPVCFSPTTDRVYCALAGANAVMVLDGVENSIRQVLPSGVKPKALLHSTLGNKVYCANAGTYDAPSTITVIDGTGDSVLRTIPTAPLRGYWYYPQVLCLNPSGDRLYEALSYDNSLLVVDAVADTIVTKVPLGEAAYSTCYGPAYNYVYVGVSSDVDVISADLNIMIAQVDVGLRPVALCYVPVGDKVYSADLSGRTVSVIAGERPERVAQIVVGGRPNALCWNSRYNKVYCACRDSNWVAAIDAVADTLVKLIPAGDEPWALSYDSLNNTVYCACRYGNNVAVIDCEQDSVIAVVQVDSQPTALAWNPIDMRMYTVNHEGYGVSVIRDSLRVAVEGQPQATGLKPQATVIRDVLFLPGPGTRSESSGGSVTSRASLLDISGRRVMTLWVGPNDIRSLAPGVYFVRREPSASDRQPSGVAKVVITR